MEKTNVLKNVPQNERNVYVTIEGLSGFFPDHPVLRRSIEISGLIEVVDTSAARRNLQKAPKLNLKIFNQLNTETGEEAKVSFVHKVCTHVYHHLKLEYKTVDAQRTNLLSKYLLSFILFEKKNLMFFFVLCLEIFTHYEGHDTYEVTTDLQFIKEKNEMEKWCRKRWTDKKLDLVKSGGSSAYNESKFAHLLYWCPKNVSFFLCAYNNICCCFYLFLRSRSHNMKNV